MTKRIVVWGTGFVGKMVIAELVRHPSFELVGVGVSSPDKVGRDVGEICGLPAPLGLTATDDVDALIDLKPDALVHYGPTAAHADANIALIIRFLRAGIDVCSTAMTPWVWPTMHLNPPDWIAPITEACELGEASCFTTGIDPGFANDLFPMTLMGLCSEVRTVRASELLDYTNYTGDYEREDHREEGDARDSRYPRFRLGRNGSHDCARRRHHARRDHHHIREVGDPDRTRVGKGGHLCRQRRRGAVHHQWRLPGRKPDSAGTRQPHRRRCRPGLADRQP